MEQVFVVLAVIVYMLFQGAARAGRRGGEGDQPESPQSAADEQAEAQDRAMEALRRWEARQRAAAAAPPVKPSTGRLPRPGETGRQEAYEAIAGMLGRREGPPPLPEDESVRSLESLESAEETPRRLRPPTRGRVVPGERRRVRDPVAPHVAARRRPVPDAPESARERRARKRERDEAAATAAVARRDQAGLERLDDFTPLARAILFAEILGRPVSERGDRTRT